MEIQESQNYCIITPLSPKLDKRETERLIREIKTHSNKQIGIDLSFVNDCTIDFINYLKNLKTGIFNINSDIFSLFTIMDIDKCIELYTTEEDFIEKRRRLLNRRFSVV